MDLRKIEPDDFSSFQAEIEKIKDGVGRTLNLAWFYIQARFRITEKEFKDYHHVDGSNDGGIDCIFQDGNTYYIVQSKYHQKSSKESFATIKHEIQKIEKTIIGENTNKYATDFINSLKRNLDKPNVYLEFIWLTTNEVQEKTRKESQQYLNDIIEKNKWKLSVDLNFIDWYALESVIYDIKHGYVPHTGKKILHFEPGEFMVVDKERSNIESIVINVKATEILDWFGNSKEIQKFLQKNVRESIGENSINKKIRESFSSSPNLFWYKHNGIIIFADWLEVDKQDKRITIRNPQIVNGAQTVSQLYKSFDADRTVNNPAKVLVRVYRLPYEDSETYRRSIDIISALNSQNKIKASDLRSTDPRQVMLENRINQLGERYSYQRKRSEGGKNSSTYTMSMTKLALYFSTCDNKKPDEGISGANESYFEEDRRYADVFPESQIKKPLTNKVDHIVFKYIDSWRLYMFISKTFKKEVAQNLSERFFLVQWYVLVDTYQQLQDWKEKVFKGTWREWMDFIASPQFETGLIKYLKPRYRIYFDLLPKSQDDPRNFYKSSNGRNAYAKNSGDFTLFKQEINKVYQQFNRD